MNIVYDFLPITSIECDKEMIPKCFMKRLIRIDNITRIDEVTEETMINGIRLGSHHPGKTIIEEQCESGTRIHLAKERWEYLYHKLEEYEKQEFLD